jgi:hypothetical protein
MILKRNQYYILMTYQLVNTTPINAISAKDRKALSIASSRALESDFKSFRLGAVVIQSKVYV